MSDFRDNNYKNTIKKLYSFIFNNNEVNFQKMFQLLKNLEEKIRKQKFVTKNATHFTKNLINKENREKIIKILKNDKHLSYILNYTNINEI